MNHEMSLVLSDNDTNTCVNLGQNTSFSNYDVTVLKIDSPSATPLCPKMYFRMIYDDFLDNYTNGILIYTSTSTERNNTVTRMTYCQGSQLGNVTEGLTTKLYTCSCPDGCSLFIQTGSEAMGMAKLKYKICEATSILWPERL